MNGPPDVVVVIPAHDESEAITATLRSVTSSLRHARRRGRVGATSVQVVAHRCSDDTATRARSVLRLRRRSAVVEGLVSATIGQVRDQGARRGLATVPEVPSACWILSTDADTRVPRDWVAQVLGQAEMHRATSVVGMTTLDSFRGSPEAQAAYQRLLDSKLVDGDELRRHDHVYGANLAVRADVYLAAGGFPHTPHGEDQQLVDRLLAMGTRVLRTRDVVVRTSGRQDGRAPNGLATLLRTLHRASDGLPGQPQVSAGETWARHSATVNAAPATPTVER